MSSRAGVSSASIKYYVREGLLPEGERSGYNRTEYNETHVSRLRLIRALVEVGGLRVQTVAALMAVLDDETQQLTDVMHAAQGSIPQAPVEVSAESIERVQAEVAKRGWQVTPDNAGFAITAAALDAFEALGRSDLADSLPGYLDAATTLAQTDMRRVAEAQGQDRLVETVVVGTILGDRMLTGLHRIAHEGVSRSAAEDGSAP